MKVIAAALFVLSLVVSAVAQPYEGPDTLWTRVHGFPELSGYSTTGVRLRCPTAV